MDKTTHKMRLQQWPEIIQAQLTCGISKTEWCRENNVPERQFSYWHRQTRKKLYEKQAGVLMPAESGNQPPLLELPIQNKYENPA